MSVIESSPRLMKVYFVREYKHFFNKNNKKSRMDYVLNISKIVKDRFGDEFYILNNIQAFLLNHEIKKMLDKAIMISNKKYQNVIYINESMSITSVLNTIFFLNNTYSNLAFDYILYDRDDEFGDITKKNVNINIIKNLFE